MKLFRRVSIVVTNSFLIFGLVSPMTALAATQSSVSAAATTPSLGTAVSYGILSNHFQHDIAATTIIGNIDNAPTTGVLGYSDEAGVGAVVVNNGTTNVNNAAWTQAGVDQNAALANLNAQDVGTCTSIGAGAVNLDAIDIDGAGPLPPGTFTPGCYVSGGAMNITVGQTVTLTGAGTYLFRPTGALTTQANTGFTLNGASACDVFWTPTAATTLGANSNFVGTDISPAGITMGNLATWTGRALAYGGTVTADSNTITVPTCAAAIPPSSNTTGEGRINVVKTVINDNGRTKTVADFELFVNNVQVVSGVTNTFTTTGGVFTVTETPDPQYTQTFSGDCDSDGTMNLNPGDYRLCVVTNDDIGAPVVVPPVPPLIDVVKVPSPLALPNGPGPVTYTYTLRNIGTVTVTNLTMIGDTCSPIVLASGDTNSNAKLEVSETWVYRCTATLTETHTNTIVATGWANGLSASDIASATVVVGVPIVPPLIHVTKVPSVLTLLAGGGLVTYTEKITNPGTVPLNNVSLADDKCGPMKYISGDVNNNSQLESTETWTYTCTANLTKTTTNTARATGDANGLTVSDFAIATVVVATSVPTLPNTGFIPSESVLIWVLVASGILTNALLIYSLRRKQI